MLSLHEYNRKLTIISQRIGQWYRDQYSGLLKENKTKFAELFTDEFDVRPGKPIQPRIRQFYSTKFYEKRIKPAFDARKAALTRRSVHTGEAVPRDVKIRADVTAELWDEETPEFREEVRLVLEREHANTVEAWESSQTDSPAKSPEELAA